eukprot:symbB.v1.2.014102.t1/scaffold1018.1/size143800/4
MKEDFFGLDFDSSNPMVPVIAHVPSEGQAAKWNQRSEPLRRLRPGLGLRSVNEMESNDSKYLLDLLQQSTGHLTLGWEEQGTNGLHYRVSLREVCSGK